MKDKIRRLIVRYGSSFVDDFEDYSEESDKHLLFEKVLNSIDWFKPIDLISKVLVVELSEFMIKFVPKGKYELEVIEEAFTNMVDLSCFPEHNTGISREDLMGLIDWELVFKELGK